MCQRTTIGWCGTSKHADNFDRVFDWPAAIVRKDGRLAIYALAVDHSYRRAALF
jgi:hypothetical protein